MKTVKVFVAATLVAAFFVVGAILGRNHLVLLVLREKLQDQELSGKKIRIDRQSYDSFKIEVLNIDGSISQIGEMKVAWNLSEKSVGFLGYLFLLDRKISSEIWLNASGRTRIAFDETDFNGEFVLDTLPPTKVSGDLSGKIENNQFKTVFNFLLEKTIWKGSAKGEIKNSDFGDVAPELELSIDTQSRKISGTARFSRGSLSFSSHNILFSDSAIQIPEQEIDGTIGFQGSLSCNVVSRLLESKVEGELSYAPEKLLRVRGTIKDDFQSIAVPFQLVWNPKKYSLTAKLEAQANENSFISAAIKNMSRELKISSGKVSGDLSNFNLKMNLKDIEARLGEAKISALNGNIQGDLKRQNLKVQDLQMQLAGGLFKIDPIIWSFKKPNYIKFLVNHLDLAELLGSMGGKLRGEGYFDGDGVLRMGDAGFQLNYLKLKNTNSGIVSYKDNTQLYYNKKIRYLNEFQALLEQGQQALVLKALENFHYDSLEIQAERPSSGELKLLLNLKGKNPDLANGQLFDISLPIEGNIESLVMGSLLQNPITDEVNKRRK